MKKFIIGIIAIFVIVYAGSGLYFSFYATKMQKVIPEKEIVKRELGFNIWNESYLDSLDTKEENIQSSNGYTIKAHFYKAKNTSWEKSNTIILSHGIGQSHTQMIAYSKYFIDKGFVAVSYDLRGSNESKNNGFVSYGFFEREDLNSIVDSVFKKYTPKKLGLFGVSLGAATTLFYGGKYDDNQKVSFYISDSSYSSVNEEFAQTLKSRYKLPYWSVYSQAKFFINTIFHFDIDEVNITNSVKRIKSPTLFLHSKVDDFVPTWMSKTLYDAKTSGIREVVTLDGNGHIDEIAHDYPKYESAINEFITKNNLGN